LRKNRLAFRTGIVYLGIFAISMTLTIITNWSIIILALSILAGILLVRHMALTPLYRLSQSTANLNENTTLFGLDRDDEIGDLARTIHQMLERERDTRELNQAILDGAPIVIGLWTEDGKPVAANRQALKYFNISDPQLLTDNIYAFFPEFQPCGTPSAEKSSMYYQRAIKEGYVRFEWMNQTLDGNPRPSDNIYTTFKQNGKTMILSYTIDLRDAKANKENERKLMDALFYREKLLTAGNQIAKILLTANNIDTLMSGMNIIGQLTGLDRVAIWHHEARDGELYFVKQHEWLSEIGKQQKEYAPGFAFPYSGSPEFFDILLSGKVINGPTSEQIPSIQTHFYEYGVVSVAILPMFLAGELTGFLSLQDCVNVRTFSKDEMDIMASVGLMYASTFNRFKLQKEQARIEVAEESNRAKSRFLARMSHEIRTPISAVLGISEIELQNPNLSLQVEESFAKIYHSANALLSLVNDILDLSKIEAGKMELLGDDYEVAAMIADAAYMHLSYKNEQIKFKMNVDENIPKYLHGDPFRIGQIINNLLSNAFKYTMDGTIELSIAWQDNETLEIAVKDSGIGMTAEQLSDLSNEYTRYHEQEYRFIEGTGLGMPIVHSLVSLMDAKITIESEVGKGTNVVVRIPQQTVSADILGKEAAQNLEMFKEISVDKKFTFIPEPMPYGNVLVVDDVEANLYVAKGLLDFYQLNVETCNNGLEAIEKVKQGKIYDLIFMDFMMPGLSGTEIMRQMRDLGYTHPIVVLTANAMIGIAEEFMKEGFDGFISKPIQTKHLDAILTKHIKDKQAPEVIEAARLTRVEKSSESDINDFQENADLLKKLRLDFSERYANIFTDICQAINTDDLKKAHFLAHTLKGTSGLIQEHVLAQAAKVLEEKLSKGEIPSGGELSVLETELNRVLKNSVLVVDDDPLNIKALMHILNQDYNVYVEKDGNTCLESTKRLKPDLILLDVVMPEISGFDVIKQLKNDADTENIPVIFITGKDSPEDEAKGFSLGAADYIYKPFTPADIKMRIKNQLRLQDIL